MITASDLRGCESVEHVCGLFERLGYVLSPFQLDTNEWASLKILPEMPEDSTLYHLTEIGTSHFFLLESSDSLYEVCRTFVARYVGVNAVTRPIVFNLARHARKLTIHACGSRKRQRRLEVSLDDPRQQDIDTLNRVELYRDRAPVAPVHELFDRALDRESLSRSFFNRFRSAVSELSRELASSSWSHSSEACDEEALLILSRMLFLYFVQEKGWLDHNRRFLIDHFRRCIASGEEFFSTVLSPLFFGCLNTPLKRRRADSGKLGKIPYLNGGLFEPSQFERLHPVLSVSNALMQSIIEDVFEHFSFSVQETGEEMAVVDPEMLGKVFESLMQSDERLASGSFYTPRAVVDVLTHRAIVHFCGANDERIRRVVDCALRNEDSLDVSTKDALAILSRLNEITVLDPACGSGAFLLSAMRSIERLMRRLSFAAGVRLEPGLRQRIVQRSLFGVDLKPQAVRLCELRLWLAIVSETNLDLEQAPPLPNLDRNILQGDSLITPLDFLGTGRGEIYRAWSQALKARGSLVEAYRSATPDERPAVARALRASDLSVASALLEGAINADEEELAIIRSQQSLLPGRVTAPRGPENEFLNARLKENRGHREKLKKGELGFFAYDCHFAHVMAEGGFSLVVGNPPWIRSHRLSPMSRTMLAARYRTFRGSSARKFHQPDVAIAFCERSLSLASPNGVISLLLPSKILNAGYAQPLRSLLTSGRNILSLHDWSDDSKRLFDADTFPLGMTLRPAQAAESGIEVTAGGETYVTSTRDLSIHESSTEWSLVPPDCMRVLKRVRSALPTLQEVLGRTPLMGVKTGANEQFFFSDLEVNGGQVRVLPDGPVMPATAVCRCVRGRDVRRWHSKDSTWMLWPPSRGWDVGLPWVRRLMEDRKLGKRGLRLSYVKAEHLGIKVAWKDVSRGLQAVVLPESVEVKGVMFPLIPNQTTYFVDAPSMEDAYLISAFLNSSLPGVFAVCMAERAKDFHYRYFAATVARLPVPDVMHHAVARHDLVRLARRAHLQENVEKEIDDIVFGLAGVSGQERDLLTAYLQKRLGDPGRS